MKNDDDYLYWIVTLFAGAFIGIFTVGFYELLYEAYEITLADMIVTIILSFIFSVISFRRLVMKK